jgi:hypothetical protein
MTGMPDTLTLCGRCRRGVLVYLGSGDQSVYQPSETRPIGWCYVCGAKGGPSVAYARRGSTMAPPRSFVPDLQRWERDVEPPDA